MDKSSSKISKFTFVILLLLLLGANYLDYLFTIKIVFGKDWQLLHPQYTPIELNPLVNWLIGLYGLSVGILLIKTIIPLVVIPTLILLFRKSKRVAFSTLGFLYGIYLITIIYQIYLAYII